MLVMSHTCHQVNSLILLSTTYSESTDIADIHKTTHAALKHSLVSDRGSLCRCHGAEEGLPAVPVRGSSVVRAVNITRPCEMAFSVDYSLADMLSESLGMKKFIV